MKTKRLLYEFGEDGYMTVWLNLSTKLYEVYDNRWLVAQFDEVSKAVSRALVLVEQQR